MPKATIDTHRHALDAGGMPNPTIDTGALAHACILVYVYRQTPWR